MRIARATFAGVLLASVLVLGGCKKKKPAVPPPQAQAPTITQPQPETAPTPPPVAAEPNRPEPEAQPETTTAPPSPAPKPKPKRAHAKPKPPVPAPSPEKPPEKTAENKPKTVVSDGSTQPATPGLSPAMTNDQAIHQKLNTNQLLETTDYNLKNLTRALSSGEQSMVQTIRSYMQQSRQASKEGDNDLAYRLAFKAHQLSEELIKR